MKGDFYWIKPAPEDGWEPAQDDGEGYFLAIGSTMPGKPAEIGLKIEPPK